MIELRKLSCGYRENPVLREVSLTFPMGKVVVLLGPNGCGKSTLLRTAMGLLSKQGGEVRFDGVEISALSAREIAKKVAYLSQSRNIPAITARRMVLHGRFPYLSYPRRYRSEDYAIVQRALEQADAADLAERPVGELSGGQRQKVYLAMALAQDTDTVLMDEPTTYMDVRHQLEVMAMHKIHNALMSSEISTAYTSAPSFCVVYLMRRSKESNNKDLNGGRGYDHHGSSWPRGRQKQVFYRAAGTGRTERR